MRLLGMEYFTEVRRNKIRKSRTNEFLFSAFSRAKKPNALVILALTGTKIINSLCFINPLFSTY
jgi:hypothetical protein